MAGAAKDGPCKATATGIYAMRLSLYVWWLDEINTTAPLFDPGRGTLTIYLKGEISDICQDGSGGKGVMRSCGTRLPPLFADVNGGVIQILFADDLWEKPGIPTFTTGGHTSGFNPMDILTIDKVTSLIGISLTDTNATWPSYMETPTLKCPAGMGDKCFPDQDGDGHPGVTVSIQSDGTVPQPVYPRSGGWHFIPAPTDLGAGLLGTGATSVYIGLRTKLGGAGAISADCKSGSGAADAEDFQSRTFDCVMKDGSKCTSAGASFVDQNVPVFHVLKKGDVPPTKWKHARSDADAKLDRSMSKGPLSTVVRLGDLNASIMCADIRAAVFPTTP
jgi:hypothetical protein